MKTSFKKNRMILFVASILVISMLSTSSASEPTIEFTYVPPRCSTDLLQGEVKNVNPADYKVAVFIFIPYAAGWWTKPYSNAPLTPISPDGKWACNITTGGIDETATWIIAFLVPNGYIPPLCTPCCEIPPELYQYPYAQLKRKMSRIITFSGYEWEVKSMCDIEIEVGPGPNYFSDGEEDVWVDEDGRLHLKITNRNGKWYCTEVFTEASLGYGKYIFYVTGRVDQLDKNVVLGLFTWDDIAPDHYYREMDIEFSRWGEETNENNAQYVVQPWDDPENTYRFHMDLKDEYSTHFFLWNRDTLYCQSLHGHPALPPAPEDIIESWTYSGNDIPPEGNENARINLWLFNGNCPSDGKDVEIIIKSFEFIPYCECDLNYDSTCDMQDWLMFGQDWGRTDCGTPPGSGNPPNDCKCDLNDDGRCDMQDWLLFGEDWGRTDCPERVD